MTRYERFSYSGRVMPREFVEKEAALKYAAQERNKVIDDCIELILNAPQTSQWRDDAKETIKIKLEKLKV